MDFFRYYMMCDDDDIGLEELKTSFWYDISSQNLSYIDYVNYVSHDPVCELAKYYLSVLWYKQAKYMIKY